MRKTIITYGTYDLLHKGHMRLLERAKELGDKLIVGITSENYDKSRGKLNVKHTLTQRIENIKKTGIADLIIIEEHEGQKIDDIQKYDVDIFAIGSDWQGKFDYLNDYCDVVYLERTKNISSTLLRNSENGIIKLGIIGCGRIAKRFMFELKFVSGIEPIGVFCRKIADAKKFSIENELYIGTDNYLTLLEQVDAVYIATSHESHYTLSKKAIELGKHVLCEKPVTLNVKEFRHLVELANNEKSVFMEALKTAYMPGFSKIISVAKSGKIGEIIDISSTFTKLIEDKSAREYDLKVGGSITELASYALLPIIKLFGNIDSFNIESVNKGNIDIYSRINIKSGDKIAVATVGIGGKSEGNLIISGTQGYIYVPSPWWLTDYFEIRNDNGQIIKKYCEQLDGDGLRYEIAEFLYLINNKELETYKWQFNETVKVIEIIEKHLLERKFN